MHAGVLLLFNDCVGNSKSDVTADLRCRCLWYQFARVNDLIALYFEFIIRICLGSIPTSIGSLTGLTYMDLDANAFVGIFKRKIRYAV